MAERLRAPAESSKESGREGGDRERWQREQWQRVAKRWQRECWQRTAEREQQPISKRERGRQGALLASGGESDGNEKQRK